MAKHLLAKNANLNRLPFILLSLYPFIENLQAHPHLIATPFQPIHLIFPLHPLPPLPQPGFVLNHLFQNTEIVGHGGLYFHLW